MKKVVLTINDAVCVQNGKDVNATELLKVMATYGEVTDFKDEVAAIETKYQTALDDVVAQNEAMKQHNLTKDEIEILNSYRTQRDITAKVLIEEKEELRQTLRNVKAEQEKTYEIITNAINKKYSGTI